MNRAYSILTIKNIDDEQRIITGIATTPTTDRMGDIVEPDGAKFTLPLPLLYQHSARQPIGQVTSAKVTKDGIAITAKIAKGIGVPFIDEAWALIKNGLVRGLSIGFQAIESARIKDTFSEHFLEWEWLELSAVTIPANAEANILTIKSADRLHLRAVSGESRGRGVAYLNSSPGASGKGTVTSPVSHFVVGEVIFDKGTGMKTIKEQIASFEATRAAHVARNKELMDKAGEDGRTLDDAETQEYDGLAEDVKKIDAHLTRLRQHEKTLVDTASTVTAENTEDADRAAATRSGSGSSAHVTWGKSQLPKGIPFTRYAMCIGKSRGNLMQAEVLSRQFMDSTPEVNLAMKAAVAAGTTQDATWAAPLVQLQEMQAEFVEFLRPLTLLGQLEGRLRRVPFNIKFTRQTAGTTGTFVGEGLPKPLGKMDFELLSMTWAKAATIIVMTEELVRFSNPSSEVLARDDLAAGIARYLDLRFIDPVYAGVANVSPASITNGITAIPSTGTTVAAITADIATALKAMAAANLNLGGLVWIMNPSVAIDLSLKRTAQDLFAFPDITATGGTFLGYPVIMSNNVALSGSPTEAFVVLLDPSNIMLADDGGVTIDMSTEASLQMDGAPTNPATSTVNLWQSNMIALRAERYINWRRRRETAVQLITMNAVW